MGMGVSSVLCQQPRKVVLKIVFVGTPTHLFFSFYFLFDMRVVSILIEIVYLLLLPSIMGSFGQIKDTGKR